MNQQPAIELIENPLAQDIHADGNLGFGIINGNMRFTLEFARADHANRGTWQRDAFKHLTLSGVVA